MVNGVVERDRLRRHRSRSRAGAAPFARWPAARASEVSTRSRPMLFIRGDEAESWRIVDPVMTAWAAGEVTMQEYAAARKRQVRRPETRRRLVK